MPVSPRLHGQSFFVRQNGALYATPLLLTLLVVEFTDIIFAVDSVPAIYALTDEPLIVFTSNVFAILGLRALYFVLAGMMDKFHLLKYGLAVVLIFVGVKMALLNELFGGKFPITWSLVIIAGVLGLSMASSLIFPKRHAEAVAGGAGANTHLR
jgi:tellurite resistance protein TerC